MTSNSTKIRSSQSDIADGDSVLITQEFSFLIYGINCCLKTIKFSENIILINMSK